MRKPHSPTARPNHGVAPTHDQASAPYRTDREAPLALAQGDSEPLCAVQAWETFEVLSPQTFKESDDVAVSAGGTVVKLTQGPLPWELPPVPGYKTARVSYHVLFGTIDMAMATNALTRVFGEDVEYNPRDREQAVMASVLVDDRGLPLGAKAFCISSFAWGLPFALVGNFRALPGWVKAEPDLQEALSRFLERRGDQGDRLALDINAILETHTWLVERFGLPAQIVRRPTFVVRVERQAKAKSPESLILNSFYLKDLARAAQHLRAGDAPTALHQFLQMQLPQAPIDLLNDRAAQEELVAPGKAPGGRWPSPGRLPLVNLQQAAVNSIVGHLGHAAGIMAVNGPPGTGKTTLLRDIIANNVVERALAMATFSDPNDAFTATNEKLYFTDRAYAAFYTLAPELRGYEMLVASSNNRAVENVSRELPLAAAVNVDAKATYFKTISDALATSNGATWGLIAAVLGNSKNRSDFADTFWWSKDWSLRQYLKYVRGQVEMLNVVDPATGKVTATRPPHVVVNEAPPTAAEARQRWHQARRELVQLKGSVDAELARLDEIRRKCQAFAEAQARFAALEAEVEAVLAAELEKQAATEAAQQRYDSSNFLVKRYQEEERHHKRHRPNWLARLFRTAHARAWAAVRAPIRAALAQATQARDSAHHTLVSIRLALHAAEVATMEDKQRLVEPKRQLDGLAANMALYRDELGDRIVDGAKRSGDHARWHLTAPWIPDSVHQKREALFATAMGVHRAFQEVAAQPMLHNLRLAMEVLGNREMANERQRAMVPHLWSTLFLSVPVISTTFASVDRMLKDLGTESLGWLLIDEAGQAPPQAAVGALRRCKRAVVVGDPLQIPPVVSLPQKLLTGVCRAYGDISPVRWAAPEASVQTLADHASQLQAEFRTSGGLPRRAGMPLLVHRRCQNPMGSISNRIAYDGQMVLAPGKRDMGDIGTVLGESCWFDVESNSDEKWSPEEGQVVANLTDRLQAAGIDAPDLFIITPFRRVSQQLQWMARTKAIALPSYRDRIGTVHTFQGREAHSVIIVLGAPGISCAGARRWATTTPNILNVAVSRARQNLYVVGSRAAWTTSGYGHELAVLPRAT